MSVRGSIWVLVPLKSLDGAKKRLADVLSAEERRELVRCMAGDVLEAALSAPGIAGVMVISRDPACQDLAVRAGARVFCEDRGADLNGALHQAAAALKAEGAAGVMVLPGDVPLASAPDIATVLAGVRGAGADGRAAALVSSGMMAARVVCFACRRSDSVPLRGGRFGNKWRGAAHGSSVPRRSSNLHSHSRWRTYASFSTLCAGSEAVADSYLSR